MYMMEREGNTTATDAKIFDMMVFLWSVFVPTYIYKIIAV